MLGLAALLTVASARPVVDKPCPIAVLWEEETADLMWIYHVGIVGESRHTSG